MADVQEGTTARSTHGIQSPAEYGCVRNRRRIHTTTRPIERRDTTVPEGIRITGPQRTILDSAEAGTGPEHIETAVRQTMRRGLVDPDELLDNAKERGGRVYRLIQSGLTGTER